MAESVVPESGDHVFVDDELLAQMSNTDLGQGAGSFFFELLSQVLWNRRDFQLPIRRLREAFNLDPFYGVSELKEERDRLYEEYRTNLTFPFPDDFWSQAGRVATLIRTKHLFPQTKSWDQFVMTFAYFGCVDIHPESPLSFLDPNTHFVTEADDGPKAFRYRRTKYGVKVEIYPGTRIEDLSALLMDQNFKDILKAVKGKRVTLKPKLHLYREFSLILDAIQRETGSLPSETELLNYIAQRHQPFYVKAFTASVNGEKGSPIATLENLKKMARKGGYLDSDI